MSNNVREWLWGGSPGLPGDGIPPAPDMNHQCESVDEPEINSTGGSQAYARELFIGAWNRVHSTELTEADFNFIPAE